MYTLTDYVSDALERRGYWPFYRHIGANRHGEVYFIPNAARSEGWNGPHVFGVVKVFERFGAVCLDADRRVIKAVEESIRELECQKSGPSEPKTGHGKPGSSNSFL